MTKVRVGEVKLTLDGLEARVMQDGRTVRTKNFHKSEVPENYLEAVKQIARNVFGHGYLRLFHTMELPRDEYNAWGFDGIHKGRPPGTKGPRMKQPELVQLDHYAVYIGESEDV